MPIVELTGNQLVQQCALCGATRRLDANVLPSESVSQIIALPACPCGAIESLIHSPKDEPPHPQPGSFGHQHRVLVDAVIEAVAEADAEGQPLAARVLSKIPAEVQAQFREALKLPTKERGAAPRPRGGS